MPPATLSQAIERIAAGEARDLVFATFLDAIYGAASDDARLAMIVDEPMMTSDERLNALAAAIAEYLARQLCLAMVPAWIAKPERRLVEPWFTTIIDSPGMKNYLAWASPAEFRNHNIFTEEQPLRRARKVSAVRAP
jgi:hypothetical protein